jgi:hypothetical protein
MAFVGWELHQKWEEYIQVKQYKVSTCSGKVPLAIYLYAKGTRLIMQNHDDISIQIKY